MLTSRGLCLSANEANPHQHSTESWHSLCKTHTYFTPNAYTLHTSPRSRTLLEQNKKIIENIVKNRTKIPPKSTQNRFKIHPRDRAGSLRGQGSLYVNFWLHHGCQSGAQRVHQNHKRSHHDGPKMHLKSIPAKRAEMYGIEKPSNPPDWAPAAAGAPFSHVPWDPSNAQTQTKNHDFGPQLAIKTV